MYILTCYRKHLRVFAFLPFLFYITSGNEDGLYNSSDPMVILNVNNFYDRVLLTDNAWIIEFYSSNCGFCINFAPTWRNFAYDVMDWNHTIMVGVVDCADFVNVPICRDYDIAAYPTIRLYGTKTRKSDMGTAIPKGDSEQLQEAIIKFLMDKQVKNLGSPTWVNLLPYESAVESIFHNAQPEAENAVLIVERKGSLIASQSILDLGGYKSVYVRKIDADSPALDYIDLSSIPAVVVVDKNGKYDTLADEPTTREEVTALIMKEFDIVRKKVNGIRDGTAGSNSSASPPPGTESDTDQVYMVDIENALSYALRNEISVTRNISGENYDALLNYIDILIRYLPLRQPVLNFLKNIQTYLKEQTFITGEEFGKTIDSVQSADSVLPEMQPWKGCLGSQPKFRGFPCGLWVTFHTLTVNAVLREVDNPDYNPKDVIRGIHGFVKHFFSCDYCSRHFQEMYAKDAETYVQKPNDEIMWFWKSHNKVNMRLKGDLSEDPYHVKQLFPTKKRCPECYQAEDNSFIEENVNRYLKKIYGAPSISYEGAQALSSTEDGQFSSGNDSTNFSKKFSLLVASFLYIFISEFVVVSL